MKKKILKASKQTILKQFVKGNKKDTQINGQVMNVSIVKKSALAELIYRFKTIPNFNRNFIYIWKLTRQIKNWYAL